MGKTENGAIWLDEKYLSAYDYWQFWRNIDDRDVVKFLKMFTDIDLNEINNLKEKNINELKDLDGYDMKILCLGRSSKNLTKV